MAKGNSWQRRPRGLTLVELLVAMVVGLFLVGGVAAVMVDSKEHFLMEQETAYLQENARFAVEQLTYDIRMAGYFGCNATGRLTNTLVNSTAASSGSYSATGIKGFEYSELMDADFPAAVEPEINPDTDVVVINRGSDLDSMQVAGHLAATATITLAAPAKLEAGDVLVMAAPSCRNMTIFQMAGPAGAGPTLQVQHGTGSVTPGNCHAALSRNAGGGYRCDGPPPAGNLGISYPAGSSLMRFVSHGYFIGDSAITGLPSLFRMTFERSGSTSTNSIEELVSGVEDMEVIYGVDLSATPDGVIDRYYSADAITLEEAAAPNYLAWDRVMTARVTLIMRSTRPVFERPLAIDLSEGFTFNDRFMRQKVTTTVRLRNRGLGV